MIRLGRLRLRRLVAVVMGVAALWVVLVPFERPLPGGDIDAFTETPVVHCSAPILGAFESGDDALILPTGRDEPVVVVDPDGYCQGGAQARLAIGLVVLVAAAGVAFVPLPARRPRPMAEADREH